MSVGDFAVIFFFVFRGLICVEFYLDQADSVFSADSDCYLRYCVIYGFGF